MGDLPLRRIPVRVSVEGTPLLVQRERVLLPGLYPEGKAATRLRFGSLPAGVLQQRTFWVSCLHSALACRAHPLAACVVTVVYPVHLGDGLAASVPVTIAPSLLQVHNTSYLDVQLCWDLQDAQQLPMQLAGAAAAPHMLLAAADAAEAGAPEGPSEQGPPAAGAAAPGDCIQRQRDVLEVQSTGAGRPAPAMASTSGGALLPLQLPRSCFTVSPASALLRGGQSCMFTVSFASSQPGRCAALLSGRQYISAAASSDAGSPGSGQDDAQAAVSSLATPRAAKLAAGATNRGSLPGAAGPAEPAAGSFEHLQEERPLRLQIFGAGRPGGPVECLVFGAFGHPCAAAPQRPVQLLRVALEAEAVEPHLAVEQAQLEDWRCRSTHHPAEHPSYRRTLTLSNALAAPLAFQLRCSGPFRLLGVRPSVPQVRRRGLLRGRASGQLLRVLGAARPVIMAWAGEATVELIPRTTRCLLPQDAEQLYGPKAMASDALFSSWRAQPETGGCGCFCLPPRESVDVQLAFEPPPAGRASARMLEQGEGGEQPAAAGPQQAACFSGCLTAAFANGGEQVVPLEVQLLRPAVRCSRQHLDFGTIHAASSRVLELELANPTLVDAAWSASIAITSSSNGQQGSSSKPQAAVRRSASPGSAAARRDGADGEAEAPGAPFTLQPSSGVLPGCGLGVPRTVRLAVTYSPALLLAHPADGRHEAVLEVRVKGSGGLAVRVALVGCSSVLESLEHGAVLARI